MRKELIRLACIVAVLTGLCRMTAVAQPAIPAGQVDLFMGVDFNYRDLFHNGRVYDFLINLTPGVKWNMGKDGRRRRRRWYRW